MLMAKQLQIRRLLKKLHIALFLVLILFSGSALSQTLLLPGDGVFVSVNASNNTFEIVPLIDLTKGTEFEISNGIWDESKEEFSENNKLQLIATERIPAGTAIQIAKGKHASFSISGELILKSDQEQLFTYQTELGKTRFIYGITWGSKKSVGDSVKLDSYTPETLRSVPNSIVELSEAPNQQYFVRNGASGTPEMIRGFVSNPNNWRSSDTPFPTFGTSFKILKAPVVNFHSLLSQRSEYF